MTYSSKGRRILRAFGKRVRAIRGTRGLSQEQLAHLANLDRTYISGVERGIRNISIINVALIAEALDVSVAELTRGI